MALSRESGDAGALCGAIRKLRLPREAQLPVYGLASLLWESPSRLSIAARWWIVSSARRLRRKPAPCPRPLTTKRNCLCFLRKGPARHEVRIVDDRGNEVQDRTKIFVVSWPFGTLATTAIPKRPKRCCRWPATGPGEYAWWTRRPLYRADGEIYVRTREGYNHQGGRNYIRTKVENLRRALREFARDYRRFRLKDESHRHGKVLSCGRLANAMRRGARLSLPR